MAPGAGGFSVRLVDDRVGHLSVSRSHHANLKIPGRLVRNQAPADGLSFLVAEKSESPDTAAEFTAGAAVGQHERDGSAGHWPIIFVDYPHDWILRPVLEYVVNRSLAFEDNDS